MFFVQINTLLTALARSSEAALLVSFLLSCKLSSYVCSVSVDVARLHLGATKQLYNWQPRPCAVVLFETLVRGWRKDTWTWLLLSKLHDRSLKVEYGVTCVNDIVKSTLWSMILFKWIIPVQNTFDRVDCLTWPVQSTFDRIDCLTWRSAGLVWAYLHLGSSLSVPKSVFLVWFLGLRW